VGVVLLEEALVGEAVMVRNWALIFRGSIGVR